MMKALIFFILASLSLGACTRRKPDADTLRMRLPGEPPTLDWTLATDNISKEVIQNLQEGLMQEDTGTHVKPNVAESLEVSPDGLTYTFKLRGDFKWSDGQPLVAKHFADAWERLLNPKTASEYAYFLFDIVGAEDYQRGQIKDFAKVGVVAADEHRLVVKLKHPVAYWAYIPSFWVTFPIRKELIEKFGDKWTEPPNLVSAGPYTLKKWEHESRLSLERNPYYPDDATTAGRPPKVEFRVVKEDSTAIALFDGGDLDIVRDLPPALLSALASRKEFVASPYLRGYYVGFNVRDPQVADIRVRQALAYAIDRTELKSIQSLAPMISPAQSWIPPGLTGASADRGLGFKPELARKIWSELRTKPTQLELWFDQNELNKIVGQNLQSQWKKNLGVDVQLNNQEWKVYLKTLHTKTPAVFRMGWGADYADTDTFMSLFTCASGNNFTGFCDKAYDRLVDQASVGGTETERAQFYDRAQKILLEEQVAIVPLFIQTNLHLVTQRVSGFKVNPMGDFYFKRFRLVKP